MVVTTAAFSSSMLSVPFIAWLIREMTSAPNGAWFDRDEVLARKHRRDLEAGLPQRFGQRAKNRNARGHVVPFRAEGVTQAGDVAALVVEVRFCQLQVDLADVGVDDDQAAEAHRRGLGHAKELRNLARHVFVYPRLARETPAVLHLVLAKEPMVGGRDLAGALEHSNLAFAAGPAAAAGGIDGQADPVRRAEQGGSGRHSGGPIEGLVGHLQLALDHLGDAWARSAR